MRIICCGNRYRGDDGVGVLVADHLRQLGIIAEVCGGEATEILEAFGRSSDVLVIDAVVSDAPVGTIHIWDAWRDKIPESVPNSTHGFGVREAIGLGQALGKSPSRLRVYGIEGRQFEAGTDASPEVKQAAHELAMRVAAEAEQMDSMTESSYSPSSPTK